MTFSRYNRRGDLWDFSDRRERIRGKCKGGFSVYLRANWLFQDSRTSERAEFVVASPGFWLGKSFEPARGTSVAGAAATLKVLVPTALLAAAAGVPIVSVSETIELTESVPDGSLTMLEEEAPFLEGVVTAQNCYRAEDRSGRIVVHVHLLTAPAGNTRLSPGNGATPPSQFAAVDQLLSVPPPFQVSVCVPMVRVSATMLSTVIVPVGT